MFDQKDSRIDQAHIETIHHTIDAAKQLAKILKELFDALKEAWKEKQENDKIAVKVDEKTYNLVEDPDTPGAYKWEKVDLNKESESQREFAASEATEVDFESFNPEPVQYEAVVEQPFTEYQAQTIARRLITDSPDGNIDNNNDNLPKLPPAIQVVRTKDNGEEEILYEQNSEGECVKNAFTEELGQEKIIDVAYEPLSELLPPDSPLLLPPGKDEVKNVQTQDNNEENIATLADEMLSQVTGETFIESSNIENNNDNQYTQDIQQEDVTNNNEEPTYESQLEALNIGYQDMLNLYESELESRITILNIGYNAQNTVLNAQIQADIESGKDNIDSYAETSSALSDYYQDEAQSIYNEYEEKAVLLHYRYQEQLNALNASYTNETKALNDKNSIATSADDMLSQVVSETEIETNDLKFDSDGLLIDDAAARQASVDNNQVPQVNFDADSTNVASNYTQFIDNTEKVNNFDSQEATQFDSDGLIIDENTETQQTPRFDNINVNENINSNVIIEQPPSVNSSINEFDNDNEQVEAQQVESENLINNENDIEAPPQEVSSSSNVENTIDTNDTSKELDNLEVPQASNKTTINSVNQNSEVVNYIPPLEDEVGFDDVDISNPPEFDSPPDDYYEEQITSESDINNEARFIAGSTASELIDASEDFRQPLEPLKGESLEEYSNRSAQRQNSVTTEEESALTIKKANLEVEETPEASPFSRRKSQAVEEPAANYTYREIASSPEVEPRAQQWARQSTVALHEIKHGGERAKVEFENNKNIALAATEMLRKYGTIENDGSRIYRSDAFVIRKEDGIISVHRRGDEAKGFSEPLMEFKLNKDGTPDIKGANLLNNLSGKTTENNMLPVEEQEFLIVAERINEGKGLPDLQSTDTREMGNALGSLAPAGTLKTLQTFKETEVLGTLNSILNQAKKEEVTFGDFTVKRERNSENRASLILTKDNDDGRGAKTLVQFDLEKTEKGIESKVAKMNISDYDITQIKDISQNILKRNQNLEMNFSNQEHSSPQQAKIDTRNVGQIPVDVHPWIQKEWLEMVDDLKSCPAHTAEIEEGLGEIQNRMDKNKGKASIPDQCVMYDKIVTHKVAMAQESSDPNATVTFMNKNDIINDLKELRLGAINQAFTPVENVTEKDALTKQQNRETPRTTPRTKQAETMEV